MMMKLYIKLMQFKDQGRESPQRQLQEILFPRCLRNPRVILSWKNCCGENALIRKLYGYYWRGLSVNIYFEVLTPGLT